MKIFNIILLITSFQIITSCGNNSDGDTIEASGNIEATNITVSAKVSGEILQILHDEGAQVFKGDTILVIDSETFELRLAEAIA